jgi:hypothetical protein
VNRLRIEEVPSRDHVEGHSGIRAQRLRRLWARQRVQQMVLFAPERFSAARASGVGDDQSGAAIARETIAFNLCRQ